jgi:hypothetical protein
MYYSTKGQLVRHPRYGCAEVLKPSDFNRAIRANAGLIRRGRRNICGRSVRPIVSQKTIGLPLQPIDLGLTQRHVSVVVRGPVLRLQPAEMRLLRMSTRCLHPCPHGGAPDDDDADHHEDREHSTDMALKRVTELAERMRPDIDAPDLPVVAAVGLAAPAARAECVAGARNQASKLGG